MSVSIHSRQVWTFEFVGASVGVDIGSHHYDSMLNITVFTGILRNEKYSVSIRPLIFLESVIDAQ